MTQEQFESSQEQHDGGPPELDMAEGDMDEGYDDERLPEDEPDNPGPESEVAIDANVKVGVRSCTAFQAAISWPLATILTSTLHDTSNAS